MARAAHPLKISALLDGHTSIDSSWTERDFAELAVAAADQAGASVKSQERMRELLPEFDDAHLKTDAALETLRQEGLL